MAPRTVQVYTSVAEEIKARIAAGDWAVGQRLPSISQLAQEFGVGTGSIREAVKVRASQGVVRIKHGRGMFGVSVQLAQVDFDPYKHFQDIGTGSILALCEARRILEPELTAFAAERGIDADHQAIREQALMMEQSITGAVFDQGGHRAIYERSAGSWSADNPQLGRR
jgi:GntR family transcriptional repressor for pyruvate dehydrogenase complex